MIRQAFLKAAAVALLALTPSIAFAQARCPVERSGGDFSAVPMPEIAMVSVTRAVDGAAFQATGATYASVVGGDPANGRLQISVRLTAPVPAECDIPLYLYDAAVTEVQRVRGVRGVLDELFTQTTAGPSHTDGSDRIVRVFETRPFTASKDGREMRLTLQVGDAGTVTPITLFWLSPNVYSLNVTPKNYADGRTELNVRLVDQALQSSGFQEVTFRVEPPSAGRIFGPNESYSPDDRRPRPSALVPLVFRTDSPPMNPPMADAMFLPFPVDTPTTVTVVSSYMGHERRAQVRIPAQDRCEPKATFRPVLGAIDITLTNGGETLCAEMTASVRAGSPLKRSSGPIYTPVTGPTRTTALAPSPDAPAPPSSPGRVVPGLAIASLPTLAATQMRTASSLSSAPVTWTGRYAMPAYYFGRNGQPAPSREQGVTKANLAPALADDAYYFVNVLLKRPGAPAGTDRLVTVLVTFADAAIINGQ